MGNLAKQLAKKLRAARGERSQLQFAKQLGVSKSSYHRMEMAGQNVTLETLEFLCKRLKCKVGDLFEDPGPAEDSER